MVRRIAALLVIATGAACASGSGGQAVGDRNLITVEEIDASSMSVVYDVVQQLRPQFLRPRPGNIAPVVYVDGSRRGGLDELRRIDKSTIREIRWVDGQDATTLYGTGHGGGAILLTSRR